LGPEEKVGTGETAHEIAKTPAEAGVFVCLRGKLVSQAKTMFLIPVASSSPVKFLPYSEVSQT